jgi:hypothetical protein
MLLNQTVAKVVLASVFLAACAQKSDEIRASYVSPVQYSNYSCDQLSEEAQRINSYALQAAGVQDKKAKGDAVAVTASLILFWPAAFFIKGDKASAAELARLKGEIQAVEQVSIQKNCRIEFNTDPSPQAG